MFLLIMIQKRKGCQRKP